VVWPKNRPTRALRDDWDVACLKSVTKSLQTMPNRSAPVPIAFGPVVAFAEDGHSRVKRKGRLGGLRFASGQQRQRSGLRAKSKGQEHIMSLTAGRGTVFTCRALPELQRPHSMRPSPYPVS
jgi:hypothetical protein